MLPAPKGPQPLDRVSPMQHRFEAMALLIHIRHSMLSYSTENPICRRPRLQANNRELCHCRLLRATNEMLRLNSGDDIAPGQVLARAAGSTRLDGAAREADSSVMSANVTPVTDTTLTICN
jgi:hypothetical protein